MGLETGTFVNDLVTTNPLGNDKKNQGDDHLRLLKTVLRNTFPTASKALNFPRASAKSANFSIAAADDKTIYYIDTTAGAIAANLPAGLVAGDAGWSIDIVKINTGTNQVFIQPPSGTINGFAYLRRTLEFVTTHVVWSGSAFFASRPNGAPVGTIRAFFGAALPNDCLWCDGAAFSGVNFLELATVLGATNAPDLRSRVPVGRDNMGVGAANRITAAGGNFDATVLGGNGGSQGGLLAQNQLPNIAPAFTGTPPAKGKVDDQKIISRTNTGVPADSLSGVSNQFFWSVGIGYDVTLPTPAGTVASINGNVAQQILSQLQPTLIVNYGIVAE